MEVFFLNDPESVNSVMVLLLDLKVIIMLRNLFIIELIDMSNMFGRNCIWIIPHTIATYIKLTNVLTGHGNSLHPCTWSW